MSRAPKAKPASPDEKAAMRAQAAFARRLDSRTPAVFAEGVGILVSEAGRIGKNVNAASKRLKRAVKLMVLTPAETVAVLSVLDVCKKNGEPRHEGVDRWW